MRYRYGKNIPFLLFPALIMCYFVLEMAFLIRKVLTPKNPLVEAYLLTTPFLLICHFSAKPVHFY